MSSNFLSLHRERIWARLMQLAEFGKTGRTGVDRQAFTLADLEARDYVIEWARERDFTVSVDTIGNVFARRDGRDPSAAPVAIGSHLDSEPTGGRFDGAYGVVAAMELFDALSEQRIVTQRPLLLSIWANEEGCRFLPGCMGSRAYADPGLLGAMLQSVDAEGRSVADALSSRRDAMSGLGRHALGEPLAAFLEAHIEQGPILERENLAVAAVSGVQGRRLFEATFQGRPAHAGTVPYAHRRDALEHALPMLSELYARAAADPQLRATPGRLLLEPNSPSVVPGKVLLTLDIRHPQAEALADASRWLSDLVQTNGVAVRGSIVEIDRSEPVEFDRELTGVARAACKEITGSETMLVSGASHDSQSLASFCPTAMVFVRCREGISHHEDEYASPEDLEAGVRALGFCLLAASRIDTPTSSQTPPHDRS